MVGKTLGPYEVIEQLGAGGMGDVYRARDTKLERDVAIKVLPEDFAADPDRLARFEREAKLLASLNHANIAAIYGLEDDGDTRYIAMELVEGETLAERIRRSGPVDVDEALRIAVQIAEALEAAHQSGVIHRDLKPANVIVTPEGQAKVLDFGLAKGYEPDGSASSISPDLSHSPTMAAATRTGVILGTASYMSPEQARGKPVDKRGDIFAFGAVLYEMLTGSLAFGGETVTDVLAAVVTGEPDWDALPPGTPAPVASLLRRCLRKDPRQRLHDIADARIEIADALAGGPESWAPHARAEALEAMPARRAFGPLGAAALAVAALVIGVFAGASFVGPSAPEGAGGRTHSVIPLEPALRLSGGVHDQLSLPSRPAFALSPDGRVLVYCAAERGRNAGSASRRLYLRRLDGDVAQPIRGTEGAEWPIFSPDGESVGFFADGALKTVHLTGGEVRTIADGISMSFGAAWGVDGTIVFVDGGASGLRRVPASGGTVTELTVVDATAGQTSHRLPHFLPGGDTVLYTRLSGWFLWAGAEIVALSLESGVETRLAQGAAPRYVDTGHLLFVRDGTLMAAPFDVDTLALGDEIRVLEDVMQAAYVSTGFADTGAAQLAVSDSGTLMYVPGGVFPEDDTRLVWYGHDGASVPLDGVPAGANQPRLSPDGRRLAFVTGRPGQMALWVHDFGQGTDQRLVTLGLVAGPTWSPAGDRIAFASNFGGGGVDMYVVSATGGDHEPILASDADRFPADWSNDGSLVFTQQARGSSRFEIWVASMESDEPPRRLFTHDQTVVHAALSPDDDFIAYVTGLGGDDGAIPDVWVRPFPEGAVGAPISPGGGTSPEWLPDGSGILYKAVEPGIWLKAPWSDGVAGRPEQLFFKPVTYGGVPGRDYDIAGDGRILSKDLDTGRTNEPVVAIHMVQHWLDELRELVPAGR